MDHENYIPGDWDQPHDEDWDAPTSAMRTTVVVAVHYKVDVEGNTPDELLRNATDLAMDVAEWGARTRLGVSVESATPLVNPRRRGGAPSAASLARRVLAAEEAEAGLFNPTTACVRYGCHENPTTHRCNRCTAVMS